MLSSVFGCLVITFIEKKNHTRMFGGFVSTFCLKLRHGKLLWNLLRHDSICLNIKIDHLFQNERIFLLFVPLYFHRSLPKVLVTIPDSSEKDIIPSWHLI